MCGLFCTILFLFCVGVGSRSRAELLFDSDWACVVIPLLSRYCDKWRAEPLVQDVAEHS